MKLKRPRSFFLLRAACVLTLVSLTMIGWAILHPRPMPVIVAMSVGQVLGTVAVALFAIVVLRDLRPVMAAPVPDLPPSTRPPPVETVDVDDAGDEAEPDAEPSAPGAASSKEEAPDDEASDDVPPAEK